MSYNIFEHPDLLLQYYQSQADEMRMRHEAIWDEIKHYTWLLSVLLSTPIGAYISSSSAKIYNIMPFLIFMPILGFIFSLIAFFVIRREFHLYNEVDAKMLFIEKHLGLNNKPEFVDSRLEKSLLENFTVKNYIEKFKPLKLSSLFLPWRAKIRSLFLFGFLVFAVLSILELLLIYMMFYT